MIEINKQNQVRVYEIAKARHLAQASVDCILAKFINRCVKSFAPTVGYEGACIQIHLLLDEDIEVIHRYLSKRNKDFLLQEVKRRLASEA